MVPNPAPIDLAIVERLVDAHRAQQGGLMPLLHAVQEAIGFVPSDALPLIARGFNLSRAEVHGVMSYYHYFRSETPGEHVVEVCRAESCKAMGADALMAHAEVLFGCKSHHTRADGRVALAPVYCLGLCAMSPAIMIDDRPYARMTTDKLDNLAKRMEIAA